MQSKEETAGKDDILRRVSRGWCRSCYCQVERLKMRWKKLNLLKSNNLTALDYALSSARYLDSTTSPPAQQLGLQNEVLSWQRQFLRLWSTRSRSLRKGRTQFVFIGPSGHVRRILLDKLHHGKSDANHHDMSSSLTVKGMLMLS